MSYKMGQDVLAERVSDGFIYVLQSARLYVGDPRFPKVNAIYRMKGLPDAPRK